MRAFDAPAGEAVDFVMLLVVRYEATKKLFSLGAWRLNIELLEEDMRASLYSTMKPDKVGKQLSLG